MMHEIKKATLLWITGCLGFRQREKTGTEWKTSASRDKFTA